MRRRALGAVWRALRFFASTPVPLRDALRGTGVAVRHAPEYEVGRYEDEARDEVPNELPTAAEPG